MKRLILLSIFLFGLFGLNAQTLEELETIYVVNSKELDSLSKQLKLLTTRVDTLAKNVLKLKDRITPFPRWKFGVFGTAGFNMSNYSNWLSKEKPNISSATIGLTFNGFMELQQKKYFLKNSMMTNLGWLKFDNKDDGEDNERFQVASDAFNLTSLFGWKISKTLALSALGEYRTSLLDGTFNNPGYLDIGSGGISWTPTSNFRLVLHTLNFNWVFSKEESAYESSLGAKVVADYTQQFSKGISWRSNLSIFASYKDFNGLSNWTWANSFSTAVKGIGIGLDLGLRGSKQESLEKELTDNPVQVYWILGVSYSLSNAW